MSRDWIAFACVLTAGSLACAPASFDHGDGSGPPATESSRASDSGTGFLATDGEGTLAEVSGGLDPPGNFPEPAVSRCGDVLGDAEAIGGLAAGWAVVALPGAMGTHGESVPQGAVRLRLSQHGMLDCGDSLTPLLGHGSGSDGDRPPFTEGPRGLEFTLSPTELALGVRTLSSLSQPEVFVQGSGAAGVDVAAGTLELLRADAECIVGVISGLQGDLGTTFLEGGFVAQTCQRQCIPTQGDAC